MDSQERKDKKEKTRHHKRFKTNGLIKVREYTEYSEGLKESYVAAKDTGDKHFIKTQADFWNETYKGDKDRKKWLFIFSFALLTTTFLAILLLLTFIPWEHKYIIENAAELRITILTFLMLKTTLMLGYLGVDRENKKGKKIV